MRAALPHKERRRAERRALRTQRACSEQCAAMATRGEERRQRSVCRRRQGVQVYGFACAQARERNPRAQRRANEVMPSSPATMSVLRRQEAAFFSSLLRCAGPWAII